MKAAKVDPDCACLRNQCRLAPQKATIEQMNSQQGPVPSKILLAPVGMMDPLHWGKAVDYRASVSDLLKEAKKLEAKIPKDAHLDLSRLNPEIRLGPLLGSIKRMAEGNASGWEDPAKDQEVQAELTEKWGEEIAALRMPWMPDEVILFFQSAGSDEAETPIGVRALFARHLIKRLFGPWIKVTPLKVADPLSYGQTWQAIVEQALPRLTVTDSSEGLPLLVTEADDTPDEPDDQDAYAAHVYGGGEDSDLFWDPFEDEAPSLWDQPLPTGQVKPDLRILYGSAAQAMRHALFLLDRVLPESAGRMWQPLEPERGEGSGRIGGPAVASPLLWQHLGHPLLGEVGAMRNEIEELKAQLEEERSAMAELQARLSYALKELDPTRFG